MRMLPPARRRPLQRAPSTRSCSYAAWMALLERESERALLDGAAQRLAGTGEGGAILLEGEPGIGKSALLDGLVEHVRAGGRATVLSARGTELESQLAFGAVRQLFAPVV